MPYLKFIKGGPTEQLIELQGGRTVFGRHPGCQVMLDHSSISRQHAQILETRGAYYLEDLRSRNGTLLNDVAVRGRLELHDADEITLCDYVFQFLLKPQPASIVDLPRDATDSSLHSFYIEGHDSGVERPLRSVTTVSRKSKEDPLQGSSIITSVDASSVRSVRFNVRPEVKLRAVLEISAALGRVLKLNEMLPVILQSLFKIFPQADAGFVLLREPATDRLAVRASLLRAHDDDDDVPISMTIVKMALEGKRAILSADAPEDSRFNSSESLADLRIHSVMCVPLVTQANQALGVIQLSTGDLGQQFSPDDLDLMASVCTQASLAVENANLHETLVIQRDLERELEFATQVQLGFLPKEHPQLSGYEFADYYEPANEVGGDYFDYVPLPNGNLAVALGDVAGKGVPAALLMARLHASARYHLLSAVNPAEALTNLNREMITGGMSFRFITLVMAVIHVKTHKVKFANAGHPPPLIRRANGKVEAIGMKESGMPLGLGGPQTFREFSTVLAPGESFLVYTDGVTEAIDSQQELYGRERLDLAIRNGPPTATELVQAVVRDVEKFYGDLPQRDDLCLVAARRLS